MQIIDRVKELRRVPASELKPNPRNWRTHPTMQQDALRGVLAEVGFADAVLARELPDGSLELIDGHLRAETAGDAVVPVLVVDLDDQQAAKVLLTHDPLAAMAGVDPESLASLLAEAHTEHPAVGKLLDSLAPDPPSVEPPADVAIPESYQLVVDCTDEAQQAELFEQLRAEGYRVRVVTL